MAKEHFTISNPKVTFRSPNVRGAAFIPIIVTGSQEWRYSTVKGGYIFSRLVLILIDLPIPKNATALVSSTTCADYATHVSDPSLMVP